MSCFVCTPEHISAIVTANYDPGFRGMPVEDAFRLLEDANIAAYNARYRGNDSSSRNVYRYKREDRLRSPVEVIRLIHTLEYQCNRTSEWSVSKAYEFLQEAKDAQIRRLEGYESAPYSI